MGSFGNGAAGSERIGSSSGAVDKEVDFAQYFCTYAFLYHQKEMLSDQVRMDAYFKAIVENKHHFFGKVYIYIYTYYITMSLYEFVRRGGTWTINLLD